MCYYLVLMAINQNGIDLIQIDRNLIGLRIFVLSLAPSYTKYKSIGL